jgi:hypothetical protein
MKTSELTGFELDLAVAKAAGEKAELNYGEVVTWKTIGYQEYRLVWRPSTDWAQGGPIIERERIGVEQHPSSEFWVSFCNGVSYVGLTPLIAAMRCYVASKLGDEIEIVKED